MTIYEVEWSMSGTAEVEADDMTEAAEIMQQSLGTLDTGMLEVFDVDEIELDFGDVE